MNKFFKSEIESNINNMYTEFQKINSESLFQYAIILVTSLLIFKNLNIGLNLVVGLIIAIILIIYYHQKQEIESDTDKKLLIKKEQNIFPALNKEAYEYPNIIEFIYTIQEFYVFNPQAFEEMIDNVNTFINIVSSVKLGNINCSENYHIAESKMHNSTNAFHSIIYKLPASPKILKKFNRAHRQLYELLHTYLDNIYDRCNEINIKKGYNNTTKIIDHNSPKPHNFYVNNKDFTYDFY